MEHKQENVDISASYLHLYLKLANQELYLFQISNWLTIDEARQLSNFLNIPLIFTDGFPPPSKGNYWRIENNNIETWFLNKLLNIGHTRDNRLLEINPVRHTP
jgi:hypothetical protein